jgi:[ribosomal protein S18]-alanine N-acetyltransferase
MEPADLDQVLAIEALSSLTPWSRALFVDEMSNRLSHCFVAGAMGDRQETVLGFLCFRTVEDESDLLDLCVHPRYRRLGIGKELMSFYADECRKRGIRRAYLEVNTLNQSAIHLYQLNSFQVLGIRKNFYPEHLDALLMAKEMGPDEERFSLPPPGPERPAKPRL